MPLWLTDASAMADAGRHPYRTIAANLRVDAIGDADRIVEALRDEGWPHANRSLVIREALSALCDELRGKTSEEVFRHFIERRSRRIPRGPRLHTAP